MNLIKNIFSQIIKGMSIAVIRFPLTAAFLIAAAAVICYTISLEETPPVMIQKVIIALIVGAFIGVAGQFKFESLEMLLNKRPLVYVFAVIGTCIYFAVLWPATDIHSEILIRSMVIVFALICSILWIPSYKGKSDFNQIALINFKSALVSILYSGILAIGIAAIIFAIDSLLLDVDDKIYGYTMTIIWVIFAPIYFLSMLPRFNVKAGDDATIEKAAVYPRTLEILLSYIAIPLFSAYTLVLIIYFGKILITSTWPSGQLGPMVLAYSAIGLVIFILTSLLENRFALFFRKTFPKILVPIVIMQLVSVWTRVDSYGITEARYYITLFGIFSLVLGVLLSFRPVSKNGMIALLAVGFAVLSIIPPVDAFTISQNSQTDRIEGYLQSENMLTDNKITPKGNATEETKVEVTNILAYLETYHSLEDIAWLPEDFDMYSDMKSTFGFEPTYPNYSVQNDYFYAAIDNQEPINLSGYDVVITMNSFSYDQDQKSSFKVQSNKTQYELISERLSDDDLKISVKNEAGETLIEADIDELIDELKESGNAVKETISADEMTYDVSKDGYNLRIIFQRVDVYNGSDPNIDYSAYVLFKDIK